MTDYAASLQRDAEARQEDDGGLYDDWADLVVSAAMATPESRDLVADMVIDDGNDDLATKMAEAIGLMTFDAYCQEQRVPEAVCPDDDRPPDDDYDRLLV